jgi:hypothetical protein
MTEILSDIDFTHRLLDKLDDLKGVGISAPEPLNIQLNYGEGEPQLTIKLDNIYEEYKSNPAQLDVLLQPFVTEVGWTVRGPRVPAREVATLAMPLMRDLHKDPFPEPEMASVKGPIVYQELVERPEERVVVQFILKKETDILSLHTGDVLPCFPDPKEVAMVAVQNLRQLVIDVGLTLSEFPVENFQSVPWSVGFRTEDAKQLLSALVIVPEVMKTLESTLNSPDGLIAAIPARDILLLSTNLEDTGVCELGLLAQYLKDQAEHPVSSFVWRFKGGLLERVQTVELEEQPHEIVSSEDINEAADMVKAQPEDESADAQSADDADSTESDAEAKADESDDDTPKGKVEKSDKSAKKDSKKKPKES